MKNMSSHSDPIIDIIAPSNMHEEDVEIKITNHINTTVAEVSGAPLHVLKQKNYISGMAARISNSRL